MLARTFAACLALLAASPASAEDIVSSLSFGHKTPLSNDERHLPGFQISSQNHDVNILSDRVILTPPYWGNARGAIWSEATVSSSDWSAELSFRASGQEQGSGNLQIWAVDSTSVGTNSIYTVGRFDGLAIVVDQYGGTGGKIRGFLNDGSKEYSVHPNPESLAFGHCDYHYRNLGRLSKLTITNHNGLTVSIDDHECFRTDKIALPAGLHLGIGAATSDNPDSFEAHSFIVKNLQPSSGSSAHVGNTHQVVGSSDHSAREANWQNSRNPHLGNEDPDADPHKIVDHQLQFDDLHIRLQHMAHTLNSMSDLQITEEERGHHRHNEVLSVAHNHAEFDKIHSKLETLERTLGQLQRDVANRPAGAPVGAPASSVTKQQIDEIAKAAKAAAPSILSLGLTMLAVQIVIVGLFAVYTSRSSRSHSKYL